MVKDFDAFISEKASELPNRRYEQRYPHHVKLIIKLLSICHEKKKTTVNHYLYSYRSIAEYMYDVLEHREVTKDGLRKAVARVAKEHKLEL